MYGEHSWRDRDRYCDYERDHDHSDYTYYKTLYDLVIFSSLLLLYNFFFRIDFYYKRAAKILYQSVSYSANQRFVTLELGLDDFEQYLNCERLFGVRSPVFLSDDKEKGWIIVLKTRSFPFLGTRMSVEVYRVEPEEGPAKRFIFKLNVLEQEKVLFSDIAIAKTSYYIKRNCLRLDSLLKKNFPLNLRIRFDVTVVDDVKNMSNSLCVTEDAQSDDILGQMRVSMKYTDCVIITDDRDFVCHKAVLTTACNILNDEIIDDVVDLRGVLDSATVSDLLEYLYTKKTPDLNNTCSTLLFAAEKYGLPRLKERCQRHLVSELRVENVETSVTLYELSFKHNADFLKKEVVTFVAVYKDQVLPTEAFRNLSEAMSNRLLLDVLNVNPDDLIKAKDRFAQSFETTTVFKEFSYFLISGTLFSLVIFGCILHLSPSWYKKQLESLHRLNNDFRNWYERLEIQKSLDRKIEGEINPFTVIAFSFLIIPAFIILFNGRRNHVNLA